MRATILKRETLQEQSKAGLVAYNTQEQTRENFARKRIENLAKSLFETEILSVVSEIERRTSKGFKSSYYPILEYPWEKTLWNNLHILTNGEKWIDGNYKHEKINLSNLYKISVLQPYGVEKKRRMRFNDSLQTGAAVVTLTTRYVARTILKQGLDVYYEENDVVKSLPCEGSSHSRLSFLKISW